MGKIQPKEITQCCDTGINTASFNYYEGINEAKKRNLKQSMDTRTGNFMVCCGDVMFTVKTTDYPNIKSRVF